MAVVATLALLAALTPPLPAHADSSNWDEEDLDELLEDYWEGNEYWDDDVPGISVAVVQDGEVVYENGRGFADLEDEVEATPESVYGLASVSKAIGGTLAAKLEEDPDVSLNLDDHSGEYLPDDGSIDDDHHDSHKLRHLLTHLACVPHYGTEPPGGNPTTHYATATAAAKAVFDDLGLIDKWGDDHEHEDCTIGQDEVYSTHAFTLLGAALEGASDETLNDLLDELFDDFGLDSMRAQFATEDLPANNRVTPYNDAGDAWDWQDNSWKVLGGGIEGSAVDLARFGWLVLDGQIVDDDTRDKLWTVDPATSVRALGWRVGPDRHGRSIARHGGSWTGSRSELRVFRDEGLVISVLSNRRGTDTFDDDGDRIRHHPGGLANDIADVVLYTPPELTVEDDVVTVDEGDEAENQGTFSTAASATIEEIEASVGDVNHWDGQWYWEWQTADGPDDSQQVTITVTDDEGGQGTVTFDLEVDNVAPTVTIDQFQVTEIDEGDEVTVEATFTDPGWEDTHVVEIDWGVPDDFPGEVVDDPSFEIVRDGGPVAPRKGEVTGTYLYGDNDDGNGFDVEVTVTDDDGGVGTDTFNLTVNNVAPTVTIDQFQVTEIDEGDEVTVEAEFTDPGWEEDHTFEIDWGVPDGHPGKLIDERLDIDEEGGPGPTNGRVIGTYQYGDTGEGFDESWFEIDVSVEDKDGGVGTDSFDLTVNNVAPTIEGIDHDHDEVDLAAGGKAILAQSGDLLEFDVHVTDPGSDDLTLDAEFGDGVTWFEESLVGDEPEPDDQPSPDVDPRDEWFHVAHSYADACTFQTTFTATDDDDGVSAPATIDVIVTGTADHLRSAGFWMTNYRQRGRTAYTPDTLQCFLDIVGQASAVFHDEEDGVDASTLDDAAQVLHPRNARGQMRVQFDRQLLAAWANFASGAIGYDEEVDTTGDGVADAAFHEVVAAAEAVRLDDDAARAELEEHKDILERINTG